jgi:hypothetical protein
MNEVEIENKRLIDKIDFLLSVIFLTDNSVSDIEMNSVSIKQIRAVMEYDKEYFKKEGEK